MSFAPIIVFCYNRPNHLKGTIAALAENTLAKKSDLIIFSDGPKNENDQVKINEIRTYIKDISGFKSLKTYLSDHNKGLADSIISGVTKVFETHDSAIVMEDDLRCSNDFLEYVNQALTTFKNRHDIISVSGFNFNIDKVNGYKESTALIQRASSLGWGTWKNRWEKVDWNVSDFKEFLESKERKEALKNAGEDILPMIIKQQRGLIDSWAVRWTYHHVKNNGFCLIPVKSKILITGNEGSGSNPVAKNIRQKMAISGEKILFNSKIEPEKWIISFIRNHNKPSLTRRVINLLKFGIW